MVKSESVKDGCVILIGASSLEIADFRIRLDRENVSYQAFATVDQFLCVVSRFEHAVVFLGGADLSFGLEEDIRVLRKRSCTAKIVVYAASPAATLQLTAMRAGASDFVDYARELPLLFEHVHRCENLTRVRFEKLQKRLNVSIAIPLADSDFAILEMLEQRMTVKEISKVIQLSPRTVHLRKKQLFTAFGVASKKELMCLLESADVPTRISEQPFDTDSRAIERERAA